MRVVVDRVAEIVRLELCDGVEARRSEAGPGVAVMTDAVGRVIGVEIGGVDLSTLHVFTVELAGVADRPAQASPARTGPFAIAQAAPPPYSGPLTWDREAEAAMEAIPFFSRGRHRLAASALARKRGVERVSADIVRDVGR